MSACVHADVCLCVCTNGQRVLVGHANMGGTGPSSGQRSSPPAHRAPLHAAREDDASQIDGLTRAEKN